MAKVSGEWHNKKSSLDHCLTNIPALINHFKKEDISYSDHSVIYVDLAVDMKNMKKQKWIERDMRKLRANPSRLVTELKKLDWTFITERPFSCTHCDYKMPPNMRQLVEKKAFRCSQCDKTFENECNVDELAEPYKCTHCGSNFSPNMSIITEEKAFSCPQCERTFSN